MNTMFSQFASHQDNCSICLSSMASPKGQAIFTAQCSHSFHFPCIVRNVQHANLRCPICRDVWDEEHVLVEPNDRTTSIVPPRPAAPSPPWAIGSPRNNSFRGISPNLSSSYQQHSRRYPSSSFMQQSRASFSDYEPLLPTILMESNDPRSVTIKTQTESLAIEAAQSHPRYPVLFSICAPSLDLENDPEGHTPIDLVTVLDVSGSMCGVKLDLVKQAVNFVIQNLGPLDRLSVVAFSTTARIVFPLCRMSVEGRENAARAVESLRADGGTNIVVGLEIGLKVLEDRTESNPVASVMLLSDGMDNYCRSASQLLARLPASFCSSDHEVPVHTFGFGSDHDPNTMHAIANASRGTFSFIESVGMIQDSFALCIGGLLSVVAQEVHLTVSSASLGVKIVEIPSGKHIKNTFGADLEGVIDVGSLYAEEEKHFLVYLFVPQSSTSETKTLLLDVSCVYKDLASNELLQVQGELVEILRPEVCSAAHQVASLEVDRQRNRISVSEAIAKAQGLAENGNLEAARVDLTRERETLSTTAAARAGDGLSNLLQTELQEVMDRMTTGELYTHAGRAYALSGMSSHSLQRAATRGDSINSCLSPDFGAAKAFPQQQQFASAGATPFGSAASLQRAGHYETSSMVRMVQKSKVLGTSTTK